MFNQHVCLREAEISGEWWKKNATCIFKADILGANVRFIYLFFLIIFLAFFGFIDSIAEEFGQETG